MQKMVQQRNDPVYSALVKCVEQGYWFAKKNIGWAPSIDSRGPTATWSNGNVDHGSFAPPRLPSGELDIQRLRNIGGSSRLGGEDEINGVQSTGYLRGEASLSWFPSYEREDLAGKPRALTNIFYMPYSTKGDKEFDRNLLGFKEIVEKEINSLGFKDLVSVEKKENSAFWWKEAGKAFGVERSEKPIEMFWPPWQRVHTLKRKWVFGLTCKHMWRDMLCDPPLQYYPAAEFVSAELR